jgi:chaperonin GroES
MLYPEGSKVLVSPDTEEEMTKGGIIIPPTVRDEHQVAITRGTIVAIGPLADIKFSDEISGTSKREARVGDKVIYARYGGAIVTEKKEDGSRGEPLRILNDEDIVCLIKSENSQ